jgi:hypothetical protein
MQTKKIITTVITVIAAAMVIMSGVMKLMKSDQVVSTLNNVGVGAYINLLGLMEIVFAGLFLYPKTMKIGFILLSCYFAGAMATELSHSGPVQNAAIPLVLVWVAAFLRDPSIFGLGNTSTK